MTPLLVGTKVRIARRNARQGNGFGPAMDRYVDDGLEYHVVRFTQANVQSRAHDGPYYYQLSAGGDNHAGGWWWSVRSLDVLDAWANWVPADPRDVPGDVEPPVPPPAPPQPAAPAIVANTGALTLDGYTKPHRVGLFSPGYGHLFNCIVSAYAMGCCGVGQLQGFSGMAVTSSDRERIKEGLTAEHAAVWLAAALNKLPYSGYNPMQARFCITDAQKINLNVKFLTEFLGAQLLWQGKNRAHGPHSGLNMYLVTLDCDDLVAVVSGTKGQNGVLFGPKKGADLDPKGRFKEWVNGF